MVKISRLMLGLALLLLVAACASPQEAAPSETATATLAPTATVTPTASATATPSPTPTPIGSAGYPLLAIAGSVDDNNFLSLELVELETEKSIVKIPYIYQGDDFFMKAVRISPDGKQIAYNDLIEEGTAILIYDLETKESRHVLTLPGTIIIYYLEWSPSMNWLSYGFYYNGETTIRYHALNVERGYTNYIGRGYVSSWLPDEDRLVYQGPTTTGFYNPATDSLTPLPRYSLSSSASAIQSHDIRFGSSGGGHYFPEMSAYSFEGSPSGVNEEYYHLIDAETRTEKAFVAHFVSDFESWTEHSVNIRDLFALSRGDYIVWLTEYVRDERPVIYSMWNIQGELPVEISSESDAIRLADLMPVKISVDETALLGVRYWEYDPANYRPPFSAVLVDILTGNIIYEYPFSVFGNTYAASNYVVGVKPLGFHLYWGD